MKVTQIKINGRVRKITNAFSSGPGCEAHSFELPRGCYVFQVGKDWWLEEPGQFKRKVIVEF
jgi:hypothetical protein